MRTSLWSALFALSLAVAPACSGEGGEGSGNCTEEGEDGDGPDGDEAGCEGSETPELATCSEYCSAYAENCTGANFSFTDAADCEAQCASYAQGEPGVEEVDTLECRWVHAQEANEDEHCQEAALESTNCIE